MEHEIGQNLIFPMQEEMEHSVIELNEVEWKRRGIPYVKSLSLRQMESLASICDTFLPSINPSGNVDDSVHTFYKTCASMAGTHQHVGVLVEETLKHPLVPLLLLVLWLLSTWFGTFLLCGTASLSTRFPYFHKFSDLPQKKREKIFRCWSSSFFYHLRMLFRTFKFLTMLVFFSQVMEADPMAFLCAGKSLSRHGDIPLLDA